VKIRRSHRTAGKYTFEVSVLPQTIGEARRDRR
jgi:hypothetical protein